MAEMNVADSAAVIAAAADGGPAMRRCVVTRAAAPKATLVRFAADPEGRLVPDLEERLPGRGLWITADRDIVASARSAALSKAARAAVEVPADLADRVEALLVRRCLETLGLARRAGQAVAGYEKVRQWLRGGRGHVILAAADGADGGREKVSRTAPDIPVVAVLTRTELGAVFGRDQCTHAVVSGSRLGDRLLRDGRRLDGFRAGAGTAISERSDGKA
jgi:predicted RNA-binding protein YlxR (DUF448 family)